MPLKTANLSQSHHGSQLLLEVVSLEESLPPLQPFVTHTLPNLAARTASPDAGIFPHVLTAWVAATRLDSPRAVIDTPAIFLGTLKRDDGTPETYAALEGGDTVQARNAQAHARQRLVLSNVAKAASGSGRPDKQTRLTPRELRLLAELVACARHQQYGVSCSPHPRRGDLFVMYIEPGTLLRRLRVERSGDNYATLERDLASLGRKLVRMQSRSCAESDWVDQSAEPLLQWVETGRISVRDGIAITRDQQRHREWAIALGSPVMQLLRCRTSDLAVISPSLWVAAGRSPISQWLALYLSGHGYDARQIYAHHFETLVRRMRLLSDQDHACLVQLDAQQRNVITSVALDQTPGAGQAPRSLPGPTERRALEKRMARAVQLVELASMRLAERGGIQRVMISPKDSPTDVRPSLIGKRRSRQDGVTWLRWAADVEDLASSVVKKAGRGALDLLRLASEAAILRRKAELPSAPIRSILKPLAARPVGRWLQHYSHWLLQQLVSIPQHTKKLFYPAGAQTRSRVPWLIAPQ